MNSSPATDYDRVTYPSAIYCQTHPDRLATLGRLMGLQPGPIGACRVLELGCGDGANLITMAHDLPGSTFVGFDLSAKPIAHGQQLAKRLDLTNTLLQQRDVLDLSHDLGQFDYIIAHGLFSWVPAAVRERILQLCGSHLTPQGIAYISYNAYPGNYLRDIARELMRFHAGHFEDPNERVRQSKAIVKFVAGARAKPGLWPSLLEQQAERLAGYTEPALFHDDLGPINQPLHFHEFMDLAAREGLQFLAEADLTDLHHEDLTPEALSMLAQLDDNIVAREQYLDFMIGRSFRQTLLCRRDLTLDRELNAAVLRELYISGDTGPKAGECDVRSQAVEEFRGLKNSVIATANPLMKGALVILGRRWPERIPFAELFHEAHAMATGETCSEPPVPGFEPVSLANGLLRCALTGFLELHSHRTSCVGVLSARPIASPLARHCMDLFPALPTPLHQPVKLEGALARQLVLLLDGTRDRADLVRDLVAAVHAGAAEVHREGKPVTAPIQAEQVFREELEGNLRALARLGLLVG